MVPANSDRHGGVSAAVEAAFVGERGFCGAA
jgi:hypothetical protein